MIQLCFASSMDIANKVALSTINSMLYLSKAVSAWCIA